MKKIMAEDIVTKIFNVLSIILFVILFCLSIMESWVNDWDLVSEYVSPVPDSLLSNLLWLVGILLIGCLFCQIRKKWKPAINMDIVAAILSVAACAFSIYWVSASNTAPQADQLIVCSYAEAFDLGDCSGLEKGGYIAINPQQLGLLTVIRVLFRLFDAGNYVAFQYFNALLIPVIIFFGYQIVKRLSRNSFGAETVFLMLMAVCVPLYCYVPFVYGEVSSTALVMLAGWMFLSCLEKFSYAKLIVLSLAMGGAVLCRQNALIFLIAFLGVVVVKICVKPDRKVISMACGMVAGVLLFQGAIWGIYNRVTPEDSHGMPAILYITMGVNDDNGMAGWHNWYNMSTFAENDYDVERASAVAKKDLREFFEKCLDDPAYAVDFYYRKMSSQWNAPMYHCLAMNNMFAGERSAFVENVYFGDLRKFVEEGMNVYQLLIYGGVLAVLIFRRKKWTGIENYILLIGVFGGFLFSLMWEAKTRYVFPYFVIMIPYAAIGITECVRCLSAKAERHIGKGGAK